MVDTDIIERNLLAVLSEVENQPAVGELFPSELMSYAEQIEFLHELIEHAGEYAIAYESLVCLLENYPFQISSNVAVKLLEVGLLMQYKTERHEDLRFNTRCGQQPHI